MNAPHPLANTMDVQSWFEEALVQHQGQEFGAAKKLYERILEVDPNQFDANHLLGMMACQLKDYDQGLAMIKRATELSPRNAGPYSNLGIFYKEINNLALSLDSYNKALELDPGFAQAYYNRANLHRDMKNDELAMADYNQALSIKPDFVDALVGRGIFLFNSKKYPQALCDYDAAIAMNPDCVDAHFNRGLLMTRLQDFAQAHLNYKTALKLKADISFLLGEKLYSQLFIAEWSDFEENAKRLATGLHQCEKVSPPLIVSAVLDSLPLQKRAAEIWSNFNYPVNTTLGPLKPKVKDLSDPRSKIRIAYVSADFQSHPVCLLMAELFELHDKTRFELFAFDSTPVKPTAQSHAMRERLQSAFDVWIDIRGLDNQEAAQLVRDHDIDIVFDLGGHTLNSRIGLLAYRAAPVQIGYIGYLGTTGAPFMDYLLADETLIPEASQTHYSEKIIYLPCYQVNDRKREISSKIFQRQDLGLPQNAVVYCCFNNTYKISPSTFNAWMRILKAVPGSVLWLLEDNPTGRVNLSHKAELFGVDPARLVFGQRMESSEYLARYALADLFLDTHPYNAGTTASDALRMGLPVITRVGESFASRMAASVLMGVKMPQLITNTEEDYEAVAIHLGLHPAELVALKNQLKAQMSDSLLFKPQEFARSLEEGMVQVLQRATQGLAPQTIRIAPRRMSSSTETLSN